jgi:hypothetical protein
MIRTIALAAFALCLCACAETGREHATANGYVGDQARLQRECDARGGFLVSTARLTGQPETESYCRIEGEPNRP